MFVGFMVGFHLRLFYGVVLIGYELILCEFVVDGGSVFEFTFGCGVLLMMIVFRGLVVW